MSTFKGVVKEFPQIRIDYFRIKNDGNDAPLAYFLSHIHSDHLSGLEYSHSGPFIYCSEVSMRLLLKLERRAHRINLQRGIAERHEFTYKHIPRSRFRILAAECPTLIELTAGNSITVTTFNVANHCPGAVMFLIEGKDHSILYTGDIRAEPCWIEFLKNHPILIPYTRGHKQLSKIYLDTSCVDQRRLPNQFSSKADGIAELLEKILQYPEEVRFHFHAWTFGYEEVWSALATSFNSNIHIDPYKHHLYQALRTQGGSIYQPVLTGYFLGNSEVEGRLTTETECRFHSCDPRINCSGLDGKRVVFIKPIVTRTGEGEILEEGMGNGDLDPHEELALDGSAIQLVMNYLGYEAPKEILDLLNAVGRSLGESIPIDVAHSGRNIAMARLRDILMVEIQRRENQTVTDRKDQSKTNSLNVKDEGFIYDRKGNILPQTIKFPYSRHSSYTELCDLLQLFRPKDVYPCVEAWPEDYTMESIFGAYYTNHNSDYDLEKFRQREELQQDEMDWSTQYSSQGSDTNSLLTSSFDTKTEINLNYAKSASPALSNAVVGDQQTGSTSPPLLLKDSHLNNEVNQQYELRKTKCKENLNLNPTTRIENKIHTHNLKHYEAHMETDQECFISVTSNTDVEGSHGATLSKPEDCQRFRLAYACARWPNEYIWGKDIGLSCVVPGRRCMSPEI